MQVVGKINEGSSREYSGTTGPEREGLHFVAEAARPNDLISIGIGSRKELEEAVPVAEKWLPPARQGRN